MASYSSEVKEIFNVYHGRKVKTDKERVVFNDRMQVKDGKTTINVPTKTPQKNAIRNNNYCYQSIIDKVILEKGC